MKVCRNISSSDILVPSVEKVNDKILSKTLTNLLISPDFTFNCSCCCGMAVMIMGKTASQCIDAHLTYAWQLIQHSTRKIR